MELRTLGTSDVRISPLIMGTWQAGKRMWVGIEDAESIRTIQAAVDAGITTIDTAEIYGDGHSEQIVAAAVGDRRDRVQYLTKVFANHLKYDEVLAACDRSLQNLQTDVIDLYQIHWPSGAFKSEVVPIAETMAALNHLKEVGKIRAIGVSNFSLMELAAAMEHGRIESLQPPYSLFWRQVERDLLHYCAVHHISILAYSPLAQGLLTGKFRRGHTFAAGDHRSAHKLFQEAHYHRVQRSLEQLQPIADRYQTSLGNLALAWLIAPHRTPAQVNAIVGARHADQSKENAKAADLRLLPEDVQAIDAIGRTVTDYLDDDPVQWNW